MRGIVEGVCKEQGAKDDLSYAAKVDELIKKGVIAQKQRPLLLFLRDYGDAGAHDLSRPSEAELAQLFGLVTNLLQNTYELPETTTALLKARTPRRPQ